MNTPTNLNKHRKLKIKNGKKAQTAVNLFKFGRANAERVKIALEV